MGQKREIDLVAVVTVVVSVVVSVVYVDGLVVLVVVFLDVDGNWHWDLYGVGHFLLDRVWDLLFNVVRLVDRDLDWVRHWLVDVYGVWFVHQVGLWLKYK